MIAAEIMAAAVDGDVVRSIVAFGEAGKIGFLRHGVGTRTKDT